MIPASALDLKGKLGMYVCVCNSVTDNQIRESVSNGVRTMDELRDSLNLAACCGRCADCARRVLNSALCEGCELNATSHLV